MAGKCRAWASSASSAQNVPASRRLAWVTGSLKSPPGGETAPTTVIEPRRTGEPSASTRPARS